ncbi:unnamed protein product [Nippostrongylus brasiliensis]|uniref:Movement protein n=1 Tax=Nippostrongylus brasiliensis TaxID=27835 RepID=A0A158R3L2_NIPBR|nr:unnamed protein product [Nippostrongylus brasiliensis]
MAYVFNDTTLPPASASPTSLPGSFPSLFPVPIFHWFLVIGLPGGDGISLKSHSGMQDSLNEASEAADFPRTALISIASVSVIMVIAVVVFCVFRCRQNPPPGDHYPMVVDSGGL